MSQNETTDAVGRLQVNELPAGHLPRLAELARQAYEQKRTKDCLDLTRAMLLIDPENADAQWMRLSIQSEMQRDLENSRAFLRQAQSRENAEDQSVSSDTAIPSDLSANSDSEGREPLPAPDTTASKRTSGVRWLAGASVFSVLIVVGATVLATMPRLRTKSNTIEPSPAASNVSDSSKQIVGENTAPPDLPQATAEIQVAPTPPPFSPGIATPAPAPPAPLASASTSRAAAPLPDRPVAAALGTIAISSPTSVDIYRDDVYLGSVPVSLELPAGTHTLEYRHGNLRKTVTHVIDSNETTKAMITFDVSVQINSKPWAEVFLDGVERKDLGQTPLSGVRVPIGSVLSFENPQFQTKKYRVTGNETGIQIVFP